MPVEGAGSASGMQHRFTHPVRVMEIRPDEAAEDEPEIDEDELLPPPPAATDDGTPVATLPRRSTLPR
jgi:hypothetical protein